MEFRSQMYCYIHKSKHVIIHPYPNFTIAFVFRLGWIITSHWMLLHYNDVIMSAMASQITSLTIVYSTVYSDADQGKHQHPRQWPLCRESGEFPAQMSSNAKSVSISWRHHVVIKQAHYESVYLSYGVSSLSITTFFRCSSGCIVGVFYMPCLQEYQLHIWILDIGTSAWRLIVEYINNCCPAE